MMLRPLVLLLGLGLGLGLAVVADGTMGQLRLVAGASLPDWTSGIGDASSLRRGMARVERAGAELRWRSTGIGGNGLEWVVGVGRPGLRLSATVAWWPGARDARLLRLEGEAELAGLSLSLPLLQGLAEGRMTLTDGAGRIPLAQPLLAELWAEALLSGLRIEGQALGGGPSRLELRPDGTWQANLALDGGVLRATARTEGQTRGGPARLDLRIIEANGFPPAWRNLLGLVARREAGGWVLQHSLPLGLPPLSG